mmetsp:Transcript_21774/g.47207  ORF Transcript_21774/g.47207 Transcript_21774/m.47207 type:complete len:405 (+) Transcript_21774:208-1422(+)
MFTSSTVQSSQNKSEPETSSTNAATTKTAHRSHISTTPRPSRRLQKQRILSFLLDTATTIFVIYHLYNSPSYVNPWEIPNAQLWIAGFVFIRFGILFYDHLVVFLIEKMFRCKVLPTRQPGAPPVRYVELDTRSVVYLSINSFNEYVFVMRLTYYLWNEGFNQQLSWKMSQISLGNTIIALGIMFVSMDVLYAPLHHFLHLPSLYPLIHKHHHRQHFPTRGYLDAGNEHPIEHMIGVICTWFAVCTSELMLPTCRVILESVMSNGFDDLKDATTVSLSGGGVHAVTVLIFFQLHAALAMMNHSPYDAQFSLPFVGSSCLFGTDNIFVRRVEAIPLVGKRLKRIITGQWFNYSVGHHEMHHRKFNFNYGQYCMLYDLMMGTFIEYQGPLGAAELESRKKSKLKGT